MKKDIEHIEDRGIKSLVNLKILQFKYCVENIYIVISGGYYAK